MARCAAGFPILTPDNLGSLEYPHPAFRPPTTMRFLTTTTAIINLFGAGALACTCNHNNDAGRWKDNDSPAAVADSLIQDNGGCYKATTQGRMCIAFTNGNDAVKQCLEETVANEQSKFDDWFLWTSITCGKYCWLVVPRRCNG